MAHGVYFPTAHPLACNCCNFPAISASADGMQTERVEWIGYLPVVCKNKPISRYLEKSLYADEKNQSLAVYIRLRNCEISRNMDESSHSAKLVRCFFLVYFILLLSYNFVTFLSINLLCFFLHFSFIAVMV